MIAYTVTTADGLRLTFVIKRDWIAAAQFAYFGRHDSFDLRQLQRTASWIKR